MAHSDFVGKLFGNYRLIRLLGEGGFADVYLGEHVHLGTLAAIKVLHTGLADFDSEDFMTEARTIAHWRHPNIVLLLDFGIERDTLFLIMDYAPNGTLRDRHPRGAHLSLVTILVYVKQVAAALQYAHQRNVIHCDIKPENMLLAEDDRVQLSDFGLAKVIRSSQSHITTEKVGGTRYYLAPEQIKGQVRRASDQYALGVVVYEWISGTCPFKGSLEEVTAKHLYAPPPLLHGKIPMLPREVEQVVLKALEKDYHNRFPCVQDFADALEQAILPHPFENQSSVNDSASSSSVDTSAPTLPPLPPSKVPGSPVPVLPAPKPDSNPPSPPSQHPLPQPVPVKPSAPLHSSVPGTSVPSQLQAQPKHKLSRRVLMREGFKWGGTIVLAALVATAVIDEISILNSRANPPHPSTPKPTPTPTPHPLGTPLYPAIDHHPAVVFSVAWSPDGKRIASGWGDDQVDNWKDNMALIWDADTGKNPLLYQGKTDKVKTVAWSPDSRFIAFGSLDGTFYTWDLSTRTNAPQSYRAHSKAVRSIAWSPDGNSIVSGSEDMTVKVWDARTGQLKFTCQPGHKATVYTVAWSSDGKYIASGSDDQNVNVYDARTGNRLAPHHLHTSRVSSVAWAPLIGSTLIASCSYDGKVRIWDALTEKDILPPFSYTDRNDRVETVAWSHDGKHIAAGGDDNKVHVWEVTNGHLIFPPYSGHQKKVWCVAWSPKGPYIVSGSFDGTAQIWQAI